jgi:hypothetical protein
MAGIFDDDVEQELLIQHDADKFKGGIPVQEILNRYTVTMSEVVDLILTIDPNRDVPNENTKLSTDTYSYVIAVLENDVKDKLIRRR